jgi:hypothetical protein
VEVKKLLVMQDLQMWRNTRWQLEMRHRVAKRIGGDLKAIEAEMAKAEGAIAELEIILEEIKKLPDVSIPAKAEQILEEADAMLKSLQ